MTECIQFAELKRMERDHAKERQKLMKDKDAGTYTADLIFQMTYDPPLYRKAKGQLSKANQTKTKMESLARELQKVREHI